mgnify:CR=1 FL=1
MSVTDPISDFLLRIRNASKAKKLRVEIPASQMKIGLADILFTIILLLMTTNRTLSKYNLSIVMVQAQYPD